MKIKSVSQFQWANLLRMCVLIEIQKEGPRGGHISLIFFMKVLFKHGIKFKFINIHIPKNNNERGTFHDSNV